MTIRDEVKKVFPELEILVTRFESLAPSWLNFREHQYGCTFWESLPCSCGWQKQIGDPLGEIFGGLRKLGFGIATPPPDRKHPLRAHHLAQDAPRKASPCVQDRRSKVKATPGTSGPSSGAPAR